MAVKNSENNNLNKPIPLIGIVIIVVLFVLRGVLQLSESEDETAGNPVSTSEVYQEIPEECRQSFGDFRREQRHLFSRFRGRHRQF